MFSGIVQEKGIINALVEGNEYLTITVNCSKNFTKEQKIGDSISVDGVCLTVTKKTNDSLTFDAVKETLNRTIIKNYVEGSCVNIESSLSYGGSVGGHLMSGHIHFAGKVEKVLTKNTNKDVQIKFPKKYKEYIFEKGYIGVNGCSLTLGKINNNSFFVHLIPETLSVTNLNTLEKGSLVNIEIDQNTIAIVETVKNSLAAQES